MNGDERAFQKKIQNFYKEQGRSFPWRNTQNPYRIFLSEIMLQQTQTARVIDKYKNFLKEFPNFRALAQAPQSQVLRQWKGLGYNRRAIALHKAAKIISREYKGRLPRDKEALLSLPGVGPASAGSIAAFAFNEPTVFIETNIRRVFIHEFFKKKDKVSDKEIEKLVERTLDRKNPRAWYFALMDFGVYLAKQEENPNRRSAHYVRQTKFEGSRRQMRGKILEKLLQSALSEEKLFKDLKIKDKKLGREIVDELMKEGFLGRGKDGLRLKN